MPCLALPRHAAPRLALPSLATPDSIVFNLALPCLAVPRLAAPGPALPCQASPRLIPLFSTSPCHALPCQALPRRAVPRHAGPCHATPCLAQPRLIPSSPQSDPHTPPAIRRVRVTHQRHAIPWPTGPHGWPTRPAHALKSSVPPQVAHVGRWMSSPASCQHPVRPLLRTLLGRGHRRCCRWIGCRCHTDHHGQTQNQLHHRPSFVTEYQNPTPPPCSRSIAGLAFR
jgi:hypothetical protein